MPYFEGNIAEVLVWAAAAIVLASLCAQFLLRREARNRAQWTNRKSPGQTGAAPGDPDAVLVRDCQRFERSVREEPGNAAAWRGWGKALVALAEKRPAAEADRLYSEAEAKFSAALGIAPGHMLAAANLASVLSKRASRKGGDEGRGLLIRACSLCERVAHCPESDPQFTRALRSHGFYSWGSTLWKLGYMTGFDGADRYYGEAEEKFSAALAIDPEHTVSANGRVLAIRMRGLLRRGEAGRPFLLQSIELCQEMARKNPGDVTGVQGWGRSLYLMGVRAPDAEAEQLYIQAEEKARFGLAAAPANEFLLCDVAAAMSDRAGLHEEERTSEIIEEASRFLKAALRDHPASWLLLSSWGYLLGLRAERMPGAETARLIEEAGRLFDEAARKMSDPGRILAAWGSLLAGKAWLVEGVEAVGLLEQARGKFADREAHGPGMYAYALACVEARLGEPDPCRQWLEKSREPGIWISADRMARDPALASVRELDWFRQLLAQ